MASKNDNDSLEKVSDDSRPGLEAALPKPRLFEAVDSDDVKQLEQILTLHPDGWQVKDKYGSTLLHRAAGKGSKECLQYLLEKDSVSKMDKTGCQPLHYAAYNGQVEAVRLLLNNSADINAKNKEGQIPLLAACLAGHIETAQLLLDQHYEKNPSDLPPADVAKNTLLHMSVIGNHSMVKELLEFMKSLGYTVEKLQELVSSVNVAHQTILHIAAIRCQLPTIQQYLSQLQLSVDADAKDNAGAKDKQEKTCEDYAQKYQQIPYVSEAQNEDISQSLQGSYRHKSPDPLSLGPNKYTRNPSIDSRVTPSTDGVNVLGDPVKRSIIKSKILHKDHGVEVRVLTIEELQPFEDRSLALNRSADTGQQLELLCGLHGNILNKLPSHCHLISPIIMVKSGANRPLMMRIIIPHALATTSKVSKKRQSDEIILYTVNTTGVLAKVKSEEYTLESTMCTVTMVIDKQQIFALTAVGKFTTHTRLFPSISHHRPPAITCIYHVFMESTSNDISVKIYCAINLPTTRKLLSDKGEEQPKAQGVFTLSHDHVDFTYQCIKNSTGWGVSNSSHKMEASSILPSPQSEHFLYPPAWEIKVFPIQNAGHVSERVTCQLLIIAGTTKLACLNFDHDRPTSYYSRQSTPASTVGPLLNQENQFPKPMQCSSRNVESMEGNTQANAVNMQLMSNGHGKSQRQKSDGE